MVLAASAAGAQGRGCEGAADCARQPPLSGLMWNRSGLPAVFPLQVRTPAGRNYFLTLLDVERDREVLAAFIVGGRFFKVLVPPGRFVLRFAHGAEWQGEERLFGPATGRLETAQPLTFRTRGYAKKAGHLVRIAPDADGRPAIVEIRGQSICQTSDTEILLPWRDLYFRMFRQWPDGGYRLEFPRGAHVFLPYAARYRHDLPLDRGGPGYLLPREFLDLSLVPRYGFSVRSRYCD